MLIAFATVLFAAAQAHAESPEASATADQQLTQLRADIEYLASEELRGRGVDDAESINRAAGYIADRMRSIGLKTDLYDGQPFQKVPLTLRAQAGAAERNQFIVSLAESDEEFVATLDTGMNPLAIGSLAGRVSGNLVFAGYGITAPKFNYDDYRNINTDGAIVMILRKEPGAANPDSRFAGKRNTRHAFFVTKVDNAIKQGASAIVLVNDPTSVEASKQAVLRRIKREQDRRRRLEEQLQSLPAEAVNIRKKWTDQIALIDAMVEDLTRDQERAAEGVIGVAEAGQRPQGKDSIPVVSISRTIANRILQHSVGRSLEEIETRIDATEQPNSFLIPKASAVLQVELKPTMADTANVVGVLSGRGALAEQSVIVGAHYDHVGMGGPGSLAPGTIEVHNGADDNASGTAALLASAASVRRQLASATAHRRVIYIAFTGEERGLIGSKYYVRAPRFPLESTVAMINMDMVGRLRDNELTVYGTGSAPLLEDIVRNINQRQQFNLFPVATGYGPSDHQSFYEAGIPVLFFFTGLHNDYHRPSDDFDKINFGGLTRITDTISEATIALATSKARPRYNQTEGIARIRRQLTAFLGVTVSDRAGGVVLTQLVPGGPAEQAGLRIGDQLRKLGNQTIRTSSDVPETVRTYAPGNKIVAEVVRQGELKRLRIELGRRP